VILNGPYLEFDNDSIIIYNILGDEEIRQELFFEKLQADFDSLVVKQSQNIHVKDFFNTVAHAPKNALASAMTAFALITGAFAMRRQFAYATV